MNIGIIPRKGASRATITRIADELEDTLILTKRTILTTPVDILFRFGSRYPSKSKYEINTVQMIKSTNDKPLTRQILRDHAISIPLTFFSKLAIHKKDNIPFPLVGQPTYHVGGRDIIVSKNIRNIDADMTSTHWSEFIPKDREWRVYIYFGKVIGVEEKIPKDRTAVAWNYSQGNSTFETVKWQQYPLDVCLLAINAANAINIDFSAVDIISKGNKNYVLELNTSPTCTAPRCRSIAKALDWTKHIIEKDNTKPKYIKISHNITSYKDIIHPCM